MAAEKPLIRIAVPGDTAEDFMQAAAKQFRGDFFVAIDQPVGKYVRIEAPFLAGGVAVRGDAIAMPAVRNGRKGLVIRLVKLDSDSLGIPIPEASKQLAVEDDTEESAVDEFDPQPTMASNVSAAVAQSIKSMGNAQPAPRPAPAPTPTPAPVSKPAIKPVKLEDLDDETREAVNEFGSATTKASELPADLAKQLAEAPPEKPVATTAAVVRRDAALKQTAPRGMPVVDAKEHAASSEEDAAMDEAFGQALDKAMKEAADKADSEGKKPRADSPRDEAEADDNDDDDAADDKPAAKASTKPETTEKVPVMEKASTTPAAAAPKSRVGFWLVMLLITAAGAGAIWFLKNQ